MKILVSLALSLFVCACTAPPASAPAASETASATTVSGVQANTDKGMMTLSAFYYGNAKELPVGTIPSTVPKVVTINAFVVNVPGAKASDAAVYWVNDLDHVWADSQVPVHSEVKTEGSTFTLTTPNLADKKVGYAMLVLRNINAGAPRFYAVGLGK